MQLFFLNNFSSLDTKFTIEGQEAKHISKVLRYKSGDKIFFTDGKGLMIVGQVAYSHSQKVDIEIINTIKTPKPKNNVYLAIAPIKNLQRFEFALEKICELGVQKIIFLKTSRTEIYSLPFDRIQQKIIESVKQSLQYYKPEISEKLISLEELESYLELESREINKFVSHCNQDKNREHLHFCSKNKALNDLLCIGPEGDFTDNEIDFLTSRNYTPVSLGDQRMRTETAAIYGVTTIKNNYL